MNPYMKFQDDILNLHTYIHTNINTHTDKSKPICPHFFQVRGIKGRGVVRSVGDGGRGVGMVEGEGVGW